MSRRVGIEAAGTVLETVGHVILVVLAAIEFAHWGDYSEIVTERLAISLISAVWALYACVLIWIGLRSRSRLRRILGFVLFGVTILKILVVDMNALDRVYRIVSFIASGLLLLVSGYFYQRYSPMLLEEGGNEETA